jgi:hypothetical protein
MKADIDGVIRDCRVIENMGYNHDCGMYCKAVEVDGKERIIVKAPGGWRTWGRNNENIGHMSHAVGQ